MNMEEKIMTKTWFCADWHFSHSNILKYSPEERSFSNIDEHDEVLIANHNALVIPEDRVYFLGDAVINKKFIHKVARMNGRKICVMGNHDEFKSEFFHENFLPLFEKVSGVKDMHFGEYRATISHKPTHPHELDYRYHFCVHGHTHNKTIMRTDNRNMQDLRYISVSMEKINMKPISTDDLKAEMIRRMDLMKKDKSNYYKNLI